jgi:hypothetical protein
MESANVRLSMKQLIQHEIKITFIDPVGNQLTKYYDVADIQTSRSLGREIGQWMARGVNYKVISTTTSMKWSE